VDGEAATERLRAICLALPEVTERVSHGSPTFFVREKRTLCTIHPSGHHGERPSIWAPAPPGVQAQLVGEEGDRFFRPPYVGGRGWIGLYLDRDVDWDEVEQIVADAYRQVAPKTLVSRWEGR
jgi:hypothetical protein